MVLKTGTPMSRPIDPRRLPDVRPHGMFADDLRVQVTWWVEWVDADGMRDRGPKRGSVQEHGIYADRPRIAAERFMLRGRSKYGIRHDHEVVIHAMSSGGWHKRAMALGFIKPNRGRVVVSRLYINGRHVVGQELRAVLDSAIAARSVKDRASRASIARVDAAPEKMGVVAKGTTKR